MPVRCASYPIASLLHRSMPHYYTLHVILILRTAWMREIYRRTDRRMRQRYTEAQGTSGSHTSDQHPPSSVSYKCLTVLHEFHCHIFHGLHRLDRFYGLQSIEHFSRPFIKIISAPKIWLSRLVLGWIGKQTISRTDCQTPISHLR